MIANISSNGSVKLGDFDINYLSIVLIPQSDWMKVMRKRGLWAWIIQWKVMILSDIEKTSNKRKFSKVTYI